MAVIGINYKNNGKKIKYESVYLFYESNKEIIFKSGDFVKDWYDAKKKYITELMDNEFLSGSSSCDHFIMDGAKYDSAYLHIIDDKPVLKYVDTTDPYYLFSQHEIFENGTEFFVEENTQPTWSELKKICGDLKVNE